MENPKPVDSSIGSPLPDIFVDHEDRSKLGLILLRLRYHEDFKYTLNLFQEIEDSLNFYCKLKFSDLTDANENLDFIRKLLIRLSDLEYPEQLVGKVTKNQKRDVLTLSFATKTPHSAPVIKVFRALFLADLFSEASSLPKTRQDEIAIQIKLSCYTQASDERLELMEELSEKFNEIFLQSDTRSFASFSEFVSNEIEVNSRWSSTKKSELLRNALLVLLAQSPVERRPNRGLSPRNKNDQKPSSSTYVRAASSPSNEFDLDEQSEGKDSIGTIVNQNVAYSSDESSRDILDQIWSFESGDLKSAMDQPTDNPIQSSLDFGDDDESFEFLDNSLQAEGVKTGRWIHNTVNTTPLATARWNQIERSVFLKNLRSLSNSKTQNNQILALIMYLMYLTGEKLESVVTWKIDNYSKITRDMRHLSLTLPTPDKAFQPDEIVLNRFEPSSAKLELPLPKEVCLILSKLSIGTQTISQAIGETEHDIKQRVREKLKVWREGRRYRLTFNRITAALRTELMVKTNDPLSTFLLSRSEMHASPTMHYYRATSHNELIATWDKCMASLLQLSSDV
jgi:hypothetical protein